MVALLAAPADAADIKVISAGAVRGLIAGMIADYSRQTGHKFDFKVGTTGQLRAIIASGEPADLIIASAPLMAELEKSGKDAAGKPRRSRARRHRRRHPRRRDRARSLDARGVQAGAHRRALGRLQRPARGRDVQHLLRRRAGPLRHRRCRRQEGGAHQRRPRRGGEGRARRGRDRRHLDQRDRCGQRRQGWRRRCRRRCSSTRSMPPRSRRAAPIRPPRAPSSPRSPGRRWRSAGRRRASSRRSKGRTTNTRTACRHSTAWMARCVFEG